MLPGKKFSPEDILSILRRRFWLLLLPTAIIAATTAAVARKLPDWYRSETVILVVPQRVPENYVKSTVTARIEDRLQSIQQQILSRTRLERVIQDFNLYEEERRTGIMEDIVERMRTQHVQIQVVRGDAFKVSYVGREPRTVMRVTERLAALFIDENTRDREIQAEGTNQFLEAQLEDARRRLIEQEKKLEAYRRAHSGELPTQLDSNLQALANTQMQIQSIVESVNRDRDRRLVLERQLAEFSAPLPAPAPAVAPASADALATTGTAAQQLDAARAQLKLLELRFTAGHPDIALMKRRVADLEKKADAEALTAPMSDVTARPVSPEEAARERRRANLADEMEQLDRQIADKLTEEKRLRGVTASYQARVDAVPTRETELIELTRDYAGVQKMYDQLLAKREDSKIAANLERRQIGEQFKLLDPARMPERPYSPDRKQMNLMGIAGGLAIGVLLAGLLEYRDTSFHKDEDVVNVLSLPVLAVVPLMLAEGEQKGRRRRRLLLHAACASTAMVCFAVLAYTFIR
jgi:polysaccharide chain length determinant protein (PEP-CTERM system associated)